jgi:hypothetical protein
MTTCSCGPTARHALHAAGIDPDAHPTPALDGTSPVIGTCEHGTVWPATPYYEPGLGEHVPAADLTGDHL